jgi:hypothetical protein
MVRFLLENAVELGGIGSVVLGAAAVAWASVTRNAN